LTRDRVGSTIEYTAGADSVLAEIPMRSSFAFLAAVAIAVTLFAVHRVRTLESRLAARELALEQALTEQRALGAILEDCQERSRAVDSQGSAPGQGPAHDVAAGRPELERCPKIREVLIAPDGTRLQTPEQRDAYFREYLEARMAKAFPDDAMDETTRSAVVDLLARIRELRSKQGGRGLGKSAASEQTDALYELQLEFEDVTGMGVGEFLESIEPRESPRVLRPEQATGVTEGEVRKRFADEISRQLGITESGSVEVYEDGTWRHE
jgi:hypothetical protein